MLIRWTSRTIVATACAGWVVGATAAPATLASLRTPAVATSSMIGAPPHCKDGFLPAQAPVSEQAAALPVAGGATFSTVDEARWKSNIKRASVDGSDPGDWTRIESNANRFLAAGEEPVSEAKRASQGMKARDAAFVFRVGGGTRYASAVGSYLIAAARAAENDFTSLCFRAIDAPAPPDAYFEQAAWLLRYVVTYDYVRGSLAAADRLTVENYVRRQAYFLAAHLDWNLRLLFPNRLAGDYGARLWDANPKSPAETFAVRRYDTDGNCKIGAGDDPESYPVYAYVDGKGAKGPQLSRLSLWFNNRKSSTAAAFGTAGLLLGDEVLVNRAKRYVMEWLTYSVWPDGSEGEYYRNGEYCIAKQGLIYAQYNIQAAVLLAHWLRLAGDASLANYSTTDGLFGTGSSGGQAKSIGAVVRTELQIVDGQLDRYFYEGWKRTQEPRAESSLGRVEARYMNAGKTVATHHALGVLLAAGSFPDVPVGALLRDAANAVERSRGDRGPPVATGFGQWQDVFGALPAVMLLK